MGAIPTSGWPRAEEELAALQLAMCDAAAEQWRPGAGVLSIGACYVCFERNLSGIGSGGDRGWAGAALALGRRPRVQVTVAGTAGGPYVAGLLALREGPLLEAAVCALPELPDVLLVNATGRDHPRRFGLASHLGSVLGIPTIGVTHRVLLARGLEPADRRGDRTQLLLDDETVGYWVRTRPGARPVAVHAAWRTDPETAVRVVMAATHRARTPEPLRRARRVARMARAASPGRGYSSSDRSG